MILFKKEGKKGVSTMAMIYCKECGKEISDQAKSCPYCGQPSEEQLKRQNLEDKNQQSSRVIYVLIGIILIILGIVISSSIGK